MKACRICLSSEGRLYALQKSLNLLYKQLTGLNNTDKRLPQWLCAECGLRLMSYNKLRQRSLRAHELLSQLLDKSKIITKKNIQKIDRLGLESNLSFSNTNLTVYNSTIDKIDAQSLNINISESSDLLVPKEEEDHILNYGPDEPLQLKYDESSIKEDTDPNLCDIEYFDEEILQLEDQSIKSDQDIEPMESSNYETPLNKSNLESQDSEKEPFEKVAITSVVSKECDLENYFTIVQLSLKQQIYELECRKDLPEYAAANFKCDLCFKWYSGKEAFDDHMFKHSLKSGEFECHICHCRFKTHLAQKLHTRRTHSQQFKCKTCDFVTSARGSAARHGKLHTGALYLCPYCVVQFNDVTTYWRHIRVRHATNSDVCVICGYSFTSARGLQVHRLKKHPDVDFEIPQNGPSCAKCKLTFASEEAHYTHIRVSHKHEDDISILKRRRNEWRNLRKPLPCEECGLQMSNFKTYKNHFQTSHPGKSRTQYFSTKASPCMCELCGYIVQHTSALEDHMKSVHKTDRLYKCKDCPNTFSQSIYLTKHCKEVHNKTVKISTDLKLSMKPNQCQHCGKIMASVASLKAHLKIHDESRKKIFKCDECGKCFYLNCRLRRHMTIHLGKDRYRCDDCDEGFYSKSELSQHVTSMHSVH